MDPYYPTIAVLLGCAALGTGVLAVAGRKRPPAPRKNYAMAFAVLLAAGGTALILSIVLYLGYL